MLTSCVFLADNEQQSSDVVVCGCLSKFYKLKLYSLEFYRLYHYLLLQIFFY